MTLLFANIEGLWNKLGQEQKETFEILFMHIVLLLVSLPVSFVTGIHSFSAVFFGGCLGGIFVVLIKLGRQFWLVKCEHGFASARKSLRTPIWLLGTTLIVVLAITGFMW